MIPLHFAKTPFFIFYPPRRAKQQFSDTLAMVTNLSTPDDTYLKQTFARNATRYRRLQKPCDFAAFRCISQGNCKQSYRKTTNSYRKTPQYARIKLFYFFLPPSSTKAADCTLFLNGDKRQKP
jgi:hypothetical protein